MRDLFPGYFEPTEAEFDEMWRTAIIVPDANILLHLLRYGEQTRKEVLDTLRSLKAQVWIPHQVGLEFLRNWRGVDADNRALHDTVQKSVTDAGNALKAAFDLASRHQTIDAKAMRERVGSFLDELSAALADAQKAHPDRGSAEAIVAEITALIGDAVGAKPSRETLDHWANEGKKRFETKTPPGYMDGKKEGIDKFGDLFIWKEILARGTEKKLPTILICDDRKEDWVWLLRGERVGARPELVEEYRAETGEAFYLYPLDAFLRHAKKYVQSKVSEETIEDIEKDQRERAKFRVYIASDTATALADREANAWDTSISSGDNVTKVLIELKKRHILAAADAASVASRKNAFIDFLLRDKGPDLPDLFGDDTLAPVPAAPLPKEDEPEDDAT